MMHRPYLSLPGSTRRQDDAQGSQSYERHLCLHKADCSLYRHRHKRALPITVCGRCFRQASGVLADDGLPALSLVLASTRCSGIGQRSQQYGHRCYVDRLIAGGQCLQRLVRICLSSAWGAMDSSLQSCRSMQEHLAAISNVVDPGTHAMFLLDQAG